MTRLLSGKLLLHNGKLQNFGFTDIGHFDEAEIDTAGYLPVLFVRKIPFTELRRIIERAGRRGCKCE